MTLTPAPRSAAGPRSASRPSARFAFCTAWPAAPLPRLSSAQITIAVPVAPSVKTPISAVSVPCTRESSGATPSSSTRTVSCSAYAASSSVASVGGRLDVTRREQPTAHRQQVRDEAHAEAELLRDLGRVPVLADRVRRQVLEDGARVRGRFERLAGARDARLPVDHSAACHTGERPEGEQRGRRVAAGVRDQPAHGRIQLRQAVAPRARCRAVPRLGNGRIGQPVRPREVDHDGVGRRLECGGGLVREAEEEHVGVTRRGSRIRDERRQRAVETRVEATGRLPGERLGTERDELQVGVREHPVERLLAGVAGRADDRRGRHRLRSIQIDENYAEMLIVAPGRSRRSRPISLGRGRLMQPFVAWPRSSCRKIAEPRPGTGGLLLNSMNASSR